MGEKKKNVKNEKNKLMKKAKNKGITLVALVVTIVVLIILAGVSINATLGDKGIITIAKQAKENIEQAQIQEQIELNELYTQIGMGTTGGDGIADLLEFKKIIAEAITKKGIETSENDSAETMAKNIADLETEVDLVRLTAATATEGDITKDKTAWINGKLVVGTRPAPISQNTGSFTFSVDNSSHSGTVKFSQEFDKVPTISFTTEYGSFGDTKGKVTITAVTRTYFTWSISYSGRCQGTVYWTATV